MTETMQLVHADLKRQEHDFTNRLVGIEEQINARFEELLKQKKQRPQRPLKTELKSMQLPPSIPHDRMGLSAGASSISEVQLYDIHP